MKKYLKLLVFSLAFIVVNDSYSAGDIDGSTRRGGKPAAKRSRSATVERPAKRVAAAKAYFGEDDVEIKKGKGSAKTGGGKGGYFWWVYTTDAKAEKKAGKVYINFINEDPVGEHASIQIFLNKASQGKHIGRWAYKKACEASSYDLVYAHIRKSNLASIRAAEAAGFVKCFPRAPQLIMRWARVK